jgi:hypothetical protein
VKNYKLLFFCLAIFITRSSYAYEDAHFKTDVIGVSVAQLNSQHWINKLIDKDNIVMTLKQVKQFNRALVKNNNHIVDPLSFEQQLSKESLLSYVNQISSIPDIDRFYNNGQKLSKTDYLQYRDNVNISAIKGINKTQWGIAVKRSALRTFPTNDRVFNQSMDLDLDRFQESALFPGDAVAVLYQRN